MASDFSGLSGQGMGIFGLLSPFAFIEEIFPDEIDRFIWDLKELVLKKYDTYFGFSSHVKVKQASWITTLFGPNQAVPLPVSYTHLTLPTICSV